MTDVITKYEKAAQRIKDVFEDHRELILSKKDEYLDGSLEDVSDEFKKEYGYDALEALSDEEKLKKLVWKDDENQSLFYDLTDGKYKNHGFVEMEEGRVKYLVKVDSSGENYSIVNSVEKKEEPADKAKVLKEIDIFIKGLREADTLITTLDEASLKDDYTIVLAVILDEIPNKSLIVILNKYFSLLYPNKWAKFIGKDYGKLAVEALLNTNSGGCAESQSELMKIQYLLTENEEMTPYEFMLTYDELIHRKADYHEEGFKKWLVKHSKEDEETVLRALKDKQLLLEQLIETEDSKLKHTPDNFFALTPYEYKEVQDLIKSVDSTHKILDDYAEYLIEEYDLGLKSDYTSKLKASKNIIFRGAPGTGKTYLARQIAADIISGGWTSDFNRLTMEEKERFEFIQFHPSYDYTDFVEGYRPVNGVDNQMGFKLMPGVFKKFLNHAIKSGKPHVFVIDEINRGEISKIFGELFFAIDPGYRGRHGAVKTQYSSIQNEEEKLYIPENVYIIGTMNDIDRSVEHFDFAMRRRFRFIEIKADDREQLKMLNHLEVGEAAVAHLKRLNHKISNTGNLNNHYHIGPSYFLRLPELGNDFDLLWKDYLEPLLEEYVRGFFDEAEILKELKAAYDGREREN